ncbi:MAG: hypothetical protein JNJ83_19010 [Verrucomicrobiaceae bacterium]|nr:hypothetical protein [Verrucomicrobiaceae bacterium]
MNEALLPIMAIQVEDTPIRLIELSDSIKKHFQGKRHDMGGLVLSILARKQLVDPWGNSYLIHLVSVSASEKEIRFVSTGPNGVFDNYRRDDDFTKIKWSPSPPIPGILLEPEER